MEKFTGIYDEPERKRLIKREHGRLKKILNNLDDDRKKAVEKLLEDAAFMAVTLDETRQIIARDGIIEDYQNGQNQSGHKKSSAVEVYDKLVNTYAKVVKQICDCIPDAPASDPAEDIMKYIMEKPR